MKPIGKYFPSSRGGEWCVSIRSRKLRNRSSDQRMNLRADICQLIRRHLTFALCLADAPIHAFDLIGEYDAGNRSRDGDFKGIPLDLRRHGTAQHQACLAVVGAWAQYQSRPVTCLFRPACGVKFSQTMSPASGTYCRATTRPLYPPLRRNPRPRADSRG